MKRKLKPLKQILEEFPEWELVDGAFISHDKWQYVITPDMFIFFGNDCLDHGRFSIDPQWLEPEEVEPEKRKLYAVKYKFTKEITFREKEDIEKFNAEFTRKPEYDIEYD